MSQIDSPFAFFDTLERMENPFKKPVQLPPRAANGVPSGSVQDYQEASEFLYSYRGSPDTFSTYRREVEHFLRWCWIISKKTLNQIVREDIENYIEFTLSLIHI